MSDFLPLLFKLMSKNCDPPSSPTTNGEQHVDEGGKNEKLELEISSMLNGRKKVSRVCIFSNLIKH